MTDLLKGKTAFLWDEQCQKAFEGLKSDLIDAPVLVIPDPDQPFEVVADASDFAIGAVLLQNGRPVAFESSKLKPSEGGWTTTDKEMLASVHAMRTWRCYLEGAKAQVTLVTDHNPNTFQPTKELHGRQVRWSEFLSRFKFTWQHRAGGLNVADPVSRRPDYAVQFNLTPTGPGFGAMTRRSAGASESAAPSGTQGVCARAPDYLAELAELVQIGRAHV